MFKSYFKIGWRNLLKNKGYSLINIGGPGDRDGGCHTHWPYGFMMKYHMIKILRTILALPG